MNIDPTLFSTPNLSPAELQRRLTLLIQTLVQELKNLQERITQLEAK